MSHICRLALLLSMAALYLAPALAAERRLVLVASAETGHAELNKAEIRQLFLGYAVTKDNYELTAAVNTSDPLLYEVFLQKVIFMSSQTYERQLVSTVFRHGGQLPASYATGDQLATALKRRPGLISFMWEDSARQFPNLIVITELWHGSTD